MALQLRPCRAPAGRSNGDNWKSFDHLCVALFCSSSAVFGTALPCRPKGHLVSELFAVSGCCCCCCFTPPLRWRVCLAYWTIRQAHLTGMSRARYQHGKLMSKTACPIHSTFCALASGPAFDLCQRVWLTARRSLCTVRRNVMGGKLRMCAIVVCVCARRIETGEHYSGRILNNWHPNDR